LNKFNSNKIARIISTLFVPPSFTLLIFIFFAFHFEIEALKIIETIVVSTSFGFILPILLFIILRKKNKIVDLDASIKEERTVPFLIASIFYAIGLILMIIMQLNIVTIALWFCYITNTLLTVVINRYWKISAHSMGASGALAALFFAIGNDTFLFLPLVLILGWSRIKLKCHSFSQVAAGIILAFTSTFLQMYLIINYFS
jgi:membrane-associated phospholipid phosphatase